MGEKVRIGCKQVNGLLLQLWTDGPDDGTGTKTKAKDGPAIRLQGINARAAGVGNTEPVNDHGVTEVDAEWWDKFLKQNSGHNALLDQGVIYQIKENPTP
jgi:hypothetical protein